MSTTLCGGKCVDTTNDPANCSGYRKVCNVPNSTSSCVKSTCGIGSCNAGFRDCDGNAGNGCEINSATDNKNCGGCNLACPVNKGMCVGSVCQPFTYTESDVLNQPNTMQTCNTWNALVAMLPAGGAGLSQVTFTGTANAGAITGITCNTPAVVQAFVTALKANTTYLSPVWREGNPNAISLHAG